MPNIIFVTAYDQFALKAFEAHALDYLLKPINAQRMDEAIEPTQAHPTRYKRHPASDKNCSTSVCRLSGKELTLDEALDDSAGQYPSRID